MAQLVFYLCLALMLFCIAYDYFKRRIQSTHLRKHANYLESKLKIAEETEQHMREQVDTLKIQLHHTFEDPITKLLGWKLFENRLHQHIRESERYQLTLAVLYIDIDNFKVINDALSYEVGDMLLCQIAERLQSCLRQVDSITRSAKDTFVVMLSQFTKPESVALVAQRILQALAQSYKIKEHELYITANIGIALFPTDGTDAPALLRSAEHALHLGKEKGTHAYQFYQEQMHVKSARELTLYSELSRESPFKDFVLYYQPIMNVENDTIICMDALLHWQHPEFGLINPDEIFALAEKQKKSMSISEWLLRTACQHFLKWRASGFSPNYLALPLSVKQLESTHFIYHLSQILQELNFNPEYLLLEIRDTNSPVAYEALDKAFNMLKYLRVHIAISQFGSGNFSLCYLKKLSVNYVKLDKSFIDDITENQQTIALMKSMLVLAQNMSLEVIVQGVDTPEQVVILKELGCKLLEGKQIGVPLPENEVTIKKLTTTS